MGSCRHVISLYSSLLLPPPVRRSLCSSSTSLFFPRRGLAIAASKSPLMEEPPIPLASPTEPVIEPSIGRSSRWKPTCLYYSQGQCTKMDDPLHLERFNHDLSVGLQVNAANARAPCSQPLDNLLVLDLEGKVEILEFPVVLIDARTMQYVDFFHSVWHDTAIPFKQVLEHFEEWLTNHQLWKNGGGGSLHQAAFVTCGNWDIKTKVPQQCTVSQINLPQYFTEWINLKDIYLNFYQRKAMGMRSMMNQLGIPLTGSHHLGIDDAKNIAKVLQRMIAEGARMQITARRSSKFPGNVEYLFQNRI